MLAEALDHRTAAGLPTAGLATRLVTSPQRGLLGERDLRRLSAIADQLPEGSTDQVILDAGLGRLAQDLGNQELAVHHWSRLGRTAGDPSGRW